MRRSECRRVGSAALNKAGQEVGEMEAAHQAKTCLCKYFGALKNKSTLLKRIAILKSLK